MAFEALNSLVLKRRKILFLVFLPHLGCHLWQQGERVQCKRDQRRHRRKESGRWIGQMCLLSLWYLWTCSWSWENSIQELQQWLLFSEFCSFFCTFQLRKAFRHIFEHIFWFSSRSRGCIWAVWLGWQSPSEALNRFHFSSHRWKFCSGDIFLREACLGDMFPWWSEWLGRCSVRWPQRPEHSWKKVVFHQKSKNLSSIV